MSDIVVLGIDISKDFFDVALMKGKQVLASPLSVYNRWTTSSIN